MQTLQDREAAFEAAFVHDQDLSFRVRSRRAKLLADWAGHLLHKVGPDLAAYRERLLGLTMEGDDSVVERLYYDFEAANVVSSRGEIRQKIAELQAIALKSLKEH